MRFLTARVVAKSMPFHIHRRKMQTVPEPRRPIHFARVRECLTLLALICSSCDHLTGESPATPQYVASFSRGVVPDGCTLEGITAICDVNYVVFAVKRANATQADEASLLDEVVHLVEKGWKKKHRNDEWLEYTQFDDVTLVIVKHPRRGLIYVMQGHGKSGENREWKDRCFESQLREDIGQLGE